MDSLFFNELKLEAPRYNLQVGSRPPGEMVAQIIASTEKILLSEKPDWVLVQGDTNTVMAGAIAASKANVKIGHVEAGLRSYDRTMPEEINRIITDHVSDKLFVPTAKQANILASEGINKSRVIITGNTIVDAIHQNLSPINEHPQKYFLLTLHRPSNVDSLEILVGLLDALTAISKKYNFPILFPVHPRTKKQIELFDIKVDSDCIKLMEPVGYLEMLSLEKNAELIFTDSGGIQEEACILQVPCVTLRENTERPETIDVGANLLVGHDPHKIIKATQKMIRTSRNWVSPFGDGTAASKIVDSL